VTVTADRDIVFVPTILEYGIATAEYNGDVLLATYKIKEKTRGNNMLENRILFI
jgi:hypothetical protein